MLMGPWLALPQRLCLLSLQREPSIDLLQAFVEHWKGITHYYIESTGKPAAHQPGTQGGGAGENGQSDHRCLGKVMPGLSGHQDISVLSQGYRHMGVRPRALAVAGLHGEVANPTLTFLGEGL